MSADNAPDDPPDEGKMVFSHRSRPFGPETVLTMDETGLSWRSGMKHGRVAFSEVTRVELAFRPANLNFKRYLVTVTGPGRGVAISNLSWQSMVASEDKSAAFLVFVRELHRRIARLGKAEFVAGIGWFRYALGLAMAGVVLAALGVLTVRLVSEGAKNVTLFALGFGLLFIWQMGSFVMRNRPRRYDPNAIPAALLPKAT